MEHFMATQTLQNEEFKKQSLYTNETLSSEKQIESTKESNNDESSGEKIIVIEKDPSRPPEREVAEEVEKEAPCVVPPPYKSLIPFPQRFVKVKVDSQSERYVELLENIHANAPLFEILCKKRKSEDHETRELLSVKRGRLYFEVVDEKIEPKAEKLVLRIEQKLPPQVQKNKPPRRRKKRKGERYVIWLDKWP
ncbi:uncharacterized protein LOC127079476 [Lathyrus oleraceus]|uniref:uncharacterized protein LOC127079476 n=1 Tax=Pisum sativum TaxID=3888 RepID=UPI0021D0851F|nr:uncharacterized protein LOC127079476 [Pisum sativum]